MTISVWRYSHLALAVSSFLFIALAAITGFILAFQPVSEKVSSYRVHNFDQLTIAQAIPVLKNAYPGITDLSVDVNQNVILKGTDADKKKVLAYVDPRTGKILAAPGKPSEFFLWVTSLHRSLFLHEIGRLFVGVIAFLLLLISVSGTVLVIQRQRGMKRFFTKVAKENFAQYYHVVLGRLSLIPIIIIALTGTWITLSRLSFFAEKKIKHKIDIDAIKSSPQKKLADFVIFQQTPLSQVQRIEFPFSDFPEDYYTLKLKDREVVVNQFTGELLSQVKYPMLTMVSNLSLDLHTGRASAIWAIILAVASLNILFFIYSGFVITLKRRANRLKKNKYKADESQYIILVGSENGNTFSYANAFHQQLIQRSKKAYLTELNNYNRYPEATHIIVMTATYGLGDAPTNASKFLNLLEKDKQQQAIHYSVLGFGSHAYPDFCKFAFQINQAIGHQQWAKPLIDIHTVNDRSPDDINLWVEAWSQQAGIELEAISGATIVAAKELKEFKVTSHIPVSTNEHTFRLRFLPKGHARIISGDLLAIYPANDHRERLYSIGMIGKEVQLCVRLHPDGLGSGFLHNLAPGKILHARIVDNPHFYFPFAAPGVIMVANGTGIAPFLGMINQNTGKNNIRLYCGFRESSSYNLYQEFLTEQLDTQKLAKINVALSREGDRQYVSHLLTQDAALIAATLERGGVIMICGSLTMQKDVFDVLENICANHTENSLSFYQSHGQILTDCY